MHNTILLDKRGGSAPGSSHDDTRVLPGDGSWVGVPSPARLPLESLFGQTRVEDTGVDAEEKAPKNRKDETSNLASRNLLLGRMEYVYVLRLVLPIRNVVLGGIDDNLAAFVVLARNNIADKVTHLLFVGQLLGRLWG